MGNGKTHLVTAMLLFVIIVSSYLIMAFNFPVAYMIATYEDLVGEWAQVLFFCSVLVLSVRLSFTQSKFRYFFIILALASFYTVMEEISWGQRLFNISSPDFFQKHNLQQETNIHNFITGPFATELKITIEYVLFCGLISFGFLYPFFLKHRWKLAVKIEKLGIPSPPIYLWPFFVLSAYLEIEPFGFNEAEIAETLIPLALTIFLAHYYFSYRNDITPENLTVLPTQISTRLATTISLIFLIVIFLSAGITYASYSSPRLKSKIDSRLENGLEKFAGRYKRYERWEIAAKLYHLVDKKEPNRPSIQRKLALCYEGLEDQENSQKYINKALRINRNRLQKKPTSISANISQAITYRQLNDQEKAEFHLNEALHYAHKRVLKKPNSSSAAYWLGNSYSQMGNYAAAYEQYKRAVELKPNNSKYKKSYLKTKIKLQKSNKEINDSENN